MYLRPIYRKKDGKRHAYWALMESVRTARGPRSQVVAYLGSLPEAERRGVAEAAAGKGAIHLARVYGENRRNFIGQHFWARGYFVSTLGRDEAVIREYIRRQEDQDKRLDQLNLWQ